MTVKTSCVLYCFQVQFAENVGDIYKVRVGFGDDTTHDENWLLDSVTSAVSDILIAHV